MKKSKKPKPPQLILENELTPPTYQTELIAQSLKHNTILCAVEDSGLAYIPITLVSDLSKQVLEEDERNLFAYLVPDGADVEIRFNQIYNRFTLHTVLTPKVIRHISELSSLNKTVQVVCMKSSVCLTALRDKQLESNRIKLIVFDGCHEALNENSIYTQIIEYIPDIHLYGMTSSIVGGSLDDPDLLEGKIDRLQEVFNARVELVRTLTSMDMPVVEATESIQVYTDSADDDLVFDIDIEHKAMELEQKIRDVLNYTYHFIGDINISKADHLYAETLFSKSATTSDSDTPADIDIEEPEYGSLEWMNINKCKNIPRQFIQEVETMLNELGSWCAGCISKNLSSMADKYRDKVSGRLDRLLLTLVSTQLKYIHAMVIEETQCINDPMDLLAYSSSKLKTVIRILKSHLPTTEFEITAAPSVSADSGHNSSDWCTKSISDLSNFSDDLSDGGQQETVTIARVKRIDNTDQHGSKIISVNQQETTLTGVIFVERKHTAFALHKFIEEMCVYDLDLYFVRSSYLIGNAQMPEVEMKKQEERLTQFRQHKVNLMMIATHEFPAYSTLNMPKCNLVTMFNSPDTYNVYSNTRSRACALNARYIVLSSEENQEQIQRFLNNYRKVQTIMSRKEDTVENDELDEAISSTVDDQCYIVPETKATATLNNSIALVNRYCAKLPSDIYTRLVASHYTEQTGVITTPYKSTIKLPNCPLTQPIQGFAMSSKKKSLQSAAVEVCKTLHQRGELDNNLTPVGKELLNDKKSDMAWKEESFAAQGCKGHPGSSKRKQFYQRKMCDLLTSPIRSDTQCYLYHVDMFLQTPVDQARSNKGRDLYVTHDYQHTIGLITAEELPLLAELTVFTRSGEERVKISLLDRITLSCTQLNTVEEFHQFIFSNILRLEKYPLKYSPKESQFNILTVTLKNSMQQGPASIDWDYMGVMLDKLKLWESRPHFTKRDEFTFREEDFIDAVVMPSYRNQDQPEYFYVAMIRSDLAPLSPFPSPDLYENFYVYYTRKYGLSITNDSQPLLDVDRTSSRLNLLVPRHLNQKGHPFVPSTSNVKNESLSKRKALIREKQILVPELCDVHPCPASMWRKLVCLPSILFRIQSLLLSYQLLVRLNGAINIETKQSADEILDLGVDLTLLDDNEFAPDIPVSNQTPPESNNELSADDSQIIPEDRGDEPELGLTCGDDCRLLESDGGDKSEFEDYDTADKSSSEDCERVAHEMMIEDVGDFNVRLDSPDTEDQLTGPNVTTILQAITMSSSNDFINLERLETVGDSYLKFSVTLSLYSQHDNQHEGRLSYARSKQVSNFRLYRLGKNLNLQEYLISSKFDPLENWLPPGYTFHEYQPIGEFQVDGEPSTPSQPCPPPLNLRTEHSLADKSIADSVESLIGAYLISGGQRAALAFMNYAGINISMPAIASSDIEENVTPNTPTREDDSMNEDKSLIEFEENINYKFRDNSLLIQAFTHASYLHNRLNNCYQRLEFLGDAVLDYVITRQLYEDQRQHSPGILTDLRSALVNNNVFSALSVKYNFHKYLRVTSVHILQLVNRFVNHQTTRNNRVTMEQLLRLEDELDIEEVEIPKILGDVFESVAGAIFLDSGFSLDAVWRVYRPLMHQQLVEFSLHIPKSAVRELLELHPDSTKFQKPERTRDGKVRVIVSVAGFEPWTGEGRSYRIAKSIAAKKALKYLKTDDELI